MLVIIILIVFPITASVILFLSSTQIIIVIITAIHLPVLQSPYHGAMQTVACSTSIQFTDRHQYLTILLPYSSCPGTHGGRRFSLLPIQITHRHQYLTIPSFCMYHSGGVCVCVCVCVRAHTHMRMFQHACLDTCCFESLTIMHVVCIFVFAPVQHS